MASKNDIIKQLREALIKEKLKSITEETIITVASALDIHGLLNFSGDSNIDNLKIKDAIHKGFEMYEEQGGYLEEISNQVEWSLHGELEVHTTVRDAIYGGLRDLGIPDDPHEKKVVNK